MEGPNLDDFGDGGVDILVDAIRRRLKSDGWLNLENKTKNKHSRDRILPTETGELQVGVQVAEGWFPDLTTGKQRRCRQEAIYVKRLTWLE